MKATVLTRDNLVKIRYTESELNALLEVLTTVPGLELQDRGYRG